MRRLLRVAALAAALGACARNPAPGDGPQPRGRRVVEYTPARIDSAWTEAQRRFRRGDWEEAERLLTRLALELRPGDPRLPHVRFHLGEAMLAQQNALQAAREFRRVADDLSGHALGSDALLRVGDAYFSLWRRPELDPTYGQTALGTYQELLARFPGTPQAAAAQRRISELQDRLAYKQLRAGVYYARLKAFDSAILYFRDLVATYPRSTYAPQALLRLIAAYRRLGYEEDVAETCGYLRRFHRDYPGATEACASVPDPIHHGHLVVAAAAREALGLDELRFVVTRDQPFKPGGLVAPPEHRAAMVALACEGEPGFAVERCELDRPGPSYTVDTLRDLHAREPGTDWALLVGADAAAGLGRWREAAALAGLARLVVLRRAGIPLAPPPLPHAVLDVPAVDISATAVRARVAAGRSIRWWVPEAVARYVEAHRLYSAPV